MAGIEDEVGLLSEERVLSSNPFASLSPTREPRTNEGTSPKRPQSPIAQSAEPPAPRIEYLVPQYFQLPGGPVTLAERKTMLREVSLTMNSADRRTAQPGSFGQLDPLAFLLWLSRSFSNKKVFLRLLIDDNNSSSSTEGSRRSGTPGRSSEMPRIRHNSLLMLWLQFLMAQHRYIDLFDLYEELGSPQDAAIMMIASAHRKTTPVEREATLKKAVPYLEANKLTWLHKQVVDEITLLNRQRAILAFQQQFATAQLFVEFPPPAALNNSALTLYETLVYLWTYHQQVASGELSPTDFEKNFAISTPRKAMATLMARARLHDWASVRKIADQSTSFGSRLLGVITGNQRSIAENNLEVFVAQVFINRGPVELMLFFAGRIPDHGLRFDVALRYRLWDVAISAAKTPEQGMLLLTRLSKQPDVNRLWIEKVVALLKTFRD